MLQSFQNLLIERDVIIADGAIGTQLIASGLTLEHCCERWNLEKPDSVFEIQKSYVDAGSDFILTNTFGGNLFRLAEDELANQLEEVNQKAVAIAKDAAQNKALVIGDVGPTGIPVEPIGPLTKDEIKNQFEAQIQSLEKARVDGFFVETMMYINEALGIVETIQEISGKPILVSFSFQKEDDQFRTIDGMSVIDVVNALRNYNITAIGANCMMGIQDYPALIHQFSSETDLPLIAKPNAGLPEMVDSKMVYKQTTESMMRYVPPLIEYGAKVIGGCCGTTHEFIKTLRQFLDSR